VGIDRESSLPIWAQIHTQLAYQIESGRLPAGTRLQPVRVLAPTLRVHSNTIRAAYKELVRTGHVVTRRGAGTVVASRGQQEIHPAALDGLVAELFHTARRLGYRVDEVQRAVFVRAASHRATNGKASVLFVECTSGEAQYLASELQDDFADAAVIVPALLTDLPRLMSEQESNLIVTSSLHADEVRRIVNGRVPMIAMLVGPSWMDLFKEVMSLQQGQCLGLVCASLAGTHHMVESLRLARRTDIEVISATFEDWERQRQMDERCALILIPREAKELGIQWRFSRPARLRDWSYEFDPSALEHLRRAIENVPGSNGNE